MKAYASSYLVGFLATTTAATALDTAISRTNVTVAMVRAAPPNWPMPIFNFNWTGVELNISETVDKGIMYIKDAASQGADIVTFPELWFPGYVSISLV